MATENDHTSLSFGRYLQEIRIEKGLSLESVSQQTRIRLETLVQIEEENHDQLPQQAFVKGFLRSYAKVIGADGDEAVRRYVTRLDVVRKIARSELDLNRSRKKFWPRLLLSLAALVGLIILTLAVVSYLRDGTDADDQTVPAESAPHSDEPAAVPAPVNTPEIASAPESKTETYALKIQSVEETWMQVVVDDKEPIEYNLSPGDRVDLEALTGYKLLIGNAGGINLLLNDKPVQLAGATGQVVNLELP